MRLLFTFIVAAWLVPVAAGLPASQSPSVRVKNVVGSWTLTSVERPEGPVANPRGLLVFDGAGHVCEITTRAERPRYRGAQATPDEALAAFMDYGGHWGAYRLDTDRAQIVYHPEGAVNPNLMARDLVRGFELAADRLTITSAGGDPTAPAGTRWVWTRVPPVEALSASYRRLIGFWREVSEKSIDTATGATLSENRRGPSVIAYTPSGFVCVHFLPATTRVVAGELPSPDEAQVVMTGYTSYIAALAVHPGFIFHHQLSTLAPAPATSLQRHYQFVNNDREVRYLFPPTIVNGQERRTEVMLTRLSGETDMLP